MSPPPNFTSSQSSRQIYLCVHARLPVEIVATDDIERYFDDNDHFTFFRFKTNLSPPLLDKIRSTVPDFGAGDDSLPALVSVDMDIETEGFHAASADVVLSSIGTGFARRWLSLMSSRQVGSVSVGSPMISARYELGLRQPLGV